MDNAEKMLKLWTCSFALLAIAACGPIPPGTLEPDLPDTPPPLLVVTGGQVDLVVDNLQTAQEKLAFIDSLNGHLAALSVNYTVEGRTMTVDIHVPSGNFGEAMTILMTQPGNVTYTNASAVDVSKRYAKLHAELMRLQRIAQGLSGAAWAEAQHTIKNLRRMMAFRLERSAFAIIILHVRESQEDSP